MNILITGATGLTGELLLKQLAKYQPASVVHCLIRETSSTKSLDGLNLKINYLIGDASQPETWQNFLAKSYPEAIVQIASIRHVPVILESIQKIPAKPRLIVVGTTGVYSQYNQFSAIYKTIEAQLREYPGSYCLLRPTMIYGSHRDKNLHKLIVFCHKYRFFPVFGTGNCLLQPIHAADLAQALYAVLQMPQINGNYDLSGGSIVTFRQLLRLVSELLEHPIHPIPIPLVPGAFTARVLESVLGVRSPIREEQILRLQEDKAYPHEAASKDFGFSPRTLAIGLRQEVALLREQGLI